MTVGRLDVDGLLVLSDTCFGFVTVEDDPEEVGPDGTVRIHVLIPITVDPGGEQKAITLAEVIARHLTPAGRLGVV